VYRDHGSDTEAPLEDPFEEDLFDENDPFGNGSGADDVHGISAPASPLLDTILADVNDDWTPATVSSSQEYFLQRKHVEMVTRNSANGTHVPPSQAFARDVLRLWQRSLSLRVFSGSLALWAGLYFLVVGYHHSGIMEDGLVPAKDYVVDEMTPAGSKSEYDISSDRRGHWALSLCHSVIALAGSTLVLVRSWGVPWWAHPNTEHPQMVMLVAFSGSYFLVDSNFVLSEVGYLIHHIMSLACFLISLMSGRYIKLVCIHLFYAELGNIAFISEHVFYSDGAWGRWVTLWFCLSRFAWVGAIMLVQWLPMCCKRQKGQVFAQWTIVDLLAFIPSLLMCTGSSAYAFKFLEHELGWNAEWSSEEIA